MTITFFGASQTYGACYRVLLDNGNEYEYHTPMCRRAGGRHEEEPT